MKWYAGKRTIGVLLSVAFAGGAAPALAAGPSPTRAAAARAIASVLHVRISVSRPTAGADPSSVASAVPAPERDNAAVSRILVGYDGSDGARRALDRAVAEARDGHGAVTVVSVASMPLDLDSPRYFGTLDDISPDEGRAFAPPPEVVAHLQEAGQILGAAGVEPDLTWAAGDPGQEIVETAKRVNAKTIVLGEHHHGFLAKLFGADVAAGVQREAGCTVILA